MKKVKKLVATTLAPLFLLTLLYAICPEAEAVVEDAKAAIELQLNSRVMTSAMSVGPELGIVDPEDILIGDFN